MRGVILMGTSAGILGSLLSSFARGVTLALSTENTFEHLQTYVYFLLSVVIAASQILTINRMMRLYPQLEIQPIYLVSLILCNLLAGAIILDEASIYSVVELI